MSNEWKQTELKYDPEKPSRVFHFSWYKHQLSGWSKFSYLLLWFGFISQGIIGFWGGLTPMTVITSISSWLGWLTVIAIVEGKAINGITAAIQVMLLTYVAVVTGNFSDIIMQATYLILLDIPVLFSKNWVNEDVKPKGLNKNQILPSLGYFAIAWFLLYIMDTTIVTSPRPIIDSMAAAVGIVGAIYTVKKYDMSFLWWFAQGVCSVVLWTITALSSPHPTWVLAFTYFMYIMNNLNAFFSPDTEWFSGMKKKIYGDRFMNPKPKK